MVMLRAGRKLPRFQRRGFERVSISILGMCESLQEVDGKRDRPLVPS